MNQNACREQLSTLFEQEIQCSEALLKALQHEKELLKAGNIEKLESVLTEKSAHVKNLENLVSQHNRVSIDHGFGIQRKDVEACIKWCDAGGSLTSRWETLLKITEDCKSQNEINGAIVSLGMRQTQEAIAVLRGQDGNADVYDNKGHSNIDPGKTRSLGAA